MSMCPEIYLRISHKLDMDLKICRWVDPLRMTVENTLGRSSEMDGRSQRPVDVYLTKGLRDLSSHLRFPHHPSNMNECGAATLIQI